MTMLCVNELCVYHLKRCKTSNLSRGHGSCFPSHANEATGFSRKEMWTHISVPALIYMYGFHFSAVARG